MAQPPQVQLELPLAGLQPGKYSEMFLDYVQDLLALEPIEHMDDLRARLQVGAMCWNAAWLEQQGERGSRAALDGLIASMPVGLRLCCQQLLRERLARFGAVPVLLEIDVTGQSVETARVQAKAMLRAPRRTADVQPGPGTPVESPGAMRPFDLLSPERAQKESRCWIVGREPELAPGTYVLREWFCTEPECDCRRALLQVHHVESRTIPATLNYAFEPSEPPYEDEAQLALDPLHPQGPSAPKLLRMFEDMVARDHAYRERLIDHYTCWKRVVDDPRHPDHPKLRSAAHDDPSHTPAFPRRERTRHGVKVGVNEPCPCGSGRKYKKCCRQ